MSPDKPRLGTSETIAFIALILALLGIAAVFTQGAYPDASPMLFRVLLWGCIIVAALSAAFLLWHHLIGPRLKGKSFLPLIVAGLSLTTILLACALGFELWDRNYDSVPKGPKLTGTIAYTIIGQAEIDGKMVPSMYIFAGISNTGTIQTAVTNYKVAVKKDGNTYQGTPLAIGKTVNIRPLNANIFDNQVVQVHDDDALYNKTATPIQPGNMVYGFLMVVFTTLSDYAALAGSGDEIMVTYTDVYGNEYRIDQISTISLQKKFPIIILPGVHMDFPEATPAPTPPAPVPVPAPRPGR
jgi:hypothetical protein